MLSNLKPNSLTEDFFKSNKKKRTTKDKRLNDSYNATESVYKMNDYDRKDEKEF